jgi:hypothetical protein
LARNDDVESIAATKQPVVQISKNLSSPFAKNIPLNLSGKSALPTRPSHPMRGALRNVTNARWDAVDADSLRRRTQAVADGEVVWSWRPDAGAKLRGSIRAATVAREPVTGESTK